MATNFGVASFGESSMERVNNANNSAAMLENNDATQDESAKSEGLLNNLGDESEGESGLSRNEPNSVSNSSPDMINLRYFN